MALTVNTKKIFDARYQDVSVNVPVDGTDSVATASVAQIAADGVTDDTNAWNAALAALPSGGTIVPAKYGSSVVSGSGIHLDTNVRYEVVGMGINLLPKANSTAITVDPGVVGGSAIGSFLRGFTIDGQGHSGTTAIHVRNANRYSFRDLIYGNCTTGLQISNDGAVGGYNEDHHFENIYGYSCGTGFLFEAVNGGSVSLEEITFNHVSLSGNTIGMDIKHGVDMRDVMMFATKIWATDPGSQTCIRLAGDITDWTAFIQMESLPGAGTNNIGVDVLSTATNIDRANLFLQFLDGAGYTWLAKTRLDVAQTLPLLYQNGVFRYEGGGTGGFPIRLRRDTDTVDRLNVSLGGFHMGPGGSTATDLSVLRDSNGNLAVNKQVIATDGVTTKTVAAKPTDASFLVAPADGTLAVDTRSTSTIKPRVWIRSGSAYVPSHGLAGYPVNEREYSANGSAQMIETYPRRTQNTDTATPTSGVMYAFGTPFDASLAIGHVAFRFATALNLGSGGHCWMAIYDPSLALLATSTDQTSAAPGVDTTLEFAVGLNPAAGSISTITLGNNGWGYLAIVIALGSGGSMGTLRSRNVSGVMSGAVVTGQNNLAVSTGSGLTDPSTAPNPLPVGTVYSNIFYAVARA